MTDRIEKSIVLKAPIEKVWRALTDHREFGAWFGVNLESPFAPGKVAEGDKTDPACTQMRFKATVVRMEEPRFFSYTWQPYAPDPKIDHSKEAPTTVEFRLEPAGGGTRVTVTESGFDAVPKDRRDLAFRKHSEGWSKQLENIREHVEK